MLANKKDLRNAMSGPEIVERLGLHTISDRIWHLVRTCKATGDGLNEGTDWLSQVLTEKETNIR